MTNSPYSYWQKQTAASPLFSDLLWNIPEQKTGHLAIFGGNAQNFSPVIKISEFAQTALPLHTVQTILPDSLKMHFPDHLQHLTFTPSTTSGSFTSSSALLNSTTELNLFFGDFSKNSATAIAIIETISSTTSPTLLTRDTIELVSQDATRLLSQPNLLFLASLPQLQKLFRAVFYPKVLLFSMPMPIVIENLHKFTLSYPATIITFHQNHLLVASSGQISSTPLQDTVYTPLSLWSGQLALKILCLNFWNPHQSFQASTTALFY